MWRDMARTQWLLTHARAIAHDPDVFPDPHIFRPSRWLDEKGKVRDDISSFNFGFGRRFVPRSVDLAS